MLLVHQSIITLTMSSQSSHSACLRKMKYDDDGISVIWTLMLCLEYLHDKKRNKDSVRQGVCWCASLFMLIATDRLHACQLWYVHNICHQLLLHMRQPYNTTFSNSFDLKGLIYSTMHQSKREIIVLNVFHCMWWFIVIPYLCIHLSCRVK